MFHLKYIMHRSQSKKAKVSEGQTPCLLHFMPGSRSALLYFSNPCFLNRRFPDCRFLITAADMAAVKRLRMIVFPKAVPDILRYVFILPNPSAAQ